MAIEVRHLTDVLSAKESYLTEPFKIPEFHVIYKIGDESR